MTHACGSVLPCGVLTCGSFGFSAWMGSSTPCPVSGGKIKGVPAVPGLLNEGRAAQVQTIQKPGCRRAFFFSLVVRHVLIVPPQLEQCPNDAQREAEGLQDFKNAHRRSSLLEEAPPARGHRWRGDSSSSRQEKSPSAV